MRSRVDAGADVPWSDYPRWVRRTRNIGGASTRGLELEAKFRLDQDHRRPPVELRANVACIARRSTSVPGPDNRLDQQSSRHRQPGRRLPLPRLAADRGGNLNWVPATTTRLAADQTSTTSTKRQWDVFMLWAFSPSVGVRLLANNLLPRDTVNTSLNDSISLSGTGLDRTRFSSSSPSWVNWQLRWELKL
jgi:outer membrane receptor for ferrienterochelin and colicins